MLCGFALCLFFLVVCRGAWLLDALQHAPLLCVGNVYAPAAQCGSSGSNNNTMPVLSQTPAPPAAQAQGP